ncbi:MAG: cation diffusion facilitator family transporter [Alphaproteobacteria bacterium]|nr:MAG: cation diffusion facilitator family transporter [Alphaproteobacteria bacterium]
MRLASLYAIATAVCLVLLKLIVWRATGSLSMLSTLIDSVLDVGMSAVTFFAIRAALIPADKEHRFGHGKAEALAALAQALFIAVSCVLLVGESVHRFLNPHPVAGEMLVILSMLASMMLTFSLVKFQSYVVQKTGSVAVAADRIHYETDTVINFSVLITMSVIWATGYDQLDAVVAGFVALYLVWCSRNILQEAFDVLLDRELPDEVREKIEKIIESDPDIRGWHDLRTRIAGPNYFIQFHLELDSHLNLIEAHNITDRIENAIIAAFPQAQVSIHQEPAGIDDARDNF